jgi:hypothetical protein
MICRRRLQAAAASTTKFYIKIYILHYILKIYVLHQDLLLLKSPSCRRCPQLLRWLLLWDLHRPNNSLVATF